jgi:hypothetical protein
MHSIVWIIILVPPCVAFVLWQGIKNRSRIGFPWQPIRLGKYSFWITLTIIYIAMLSAALIEHKL